MNRKVKQPGQSVQPKRESVTPKRGLASLKIWQLVGLLIVVVFGTILFVGLAGGWFSEARVKLDAECYCGSECEDGFMELSGEEYERLVEEDGSFVVFVDQGGCTTADRLRDYIISYAKKNGFRVFRILFSEMKETSLHNYVKYYPSVAVVSRGTVRRFLRADSDGDAGYYNDFNEFKKWMSELVE